MEKPLNILIVDDDEDDFVLTSACFGDLTGWNIELEWCPTYEKAVEDIAHCRHDLYIFDYLLGSQTGIDLIQKAIELNCEQPIVLLTGKGDEKLALEALRLGAADYLVKSELEPIILARSLRYSLERTKVTKALRKSERRYRKIFEESKDMLFISDLAGNLIDFNDSTCVLTGYPAIEVLEKKIPDFFDESEIGLTWEDIAAGKEVYGQEVKFLTREGDKKTGMFYASLETDQELTYVQGRVHDITLSKQAERERLFSEKLGVTSRLVRMLAHEVRNPLTNVALSTEQLESELEDEELKFYTDIIKRNCARINDLITQLLQSSRPNEFNLAPGYLHIALDDTLDTAYDRLKLKKISIEKQYEAFAPKIMLNPDMLKIAFLNLITNAVEAMEEGKGILKVTTRQIDGDVQVQIADNGSGISEENMNKVFEPFFTGKKSGMGIGLASTLNIVQSHRGRVDVQSEEGVGTVFMLSFPLETT